MRKKTAATALVVLALAPALAACGSSKSSSAGSSAAQATTSATTAQTTASATSTAATKGKKAGKTSGAMSTTGANGCHPVSKKGNCYTPMEFCAKTQHGLKGVAADGKKIVCKQNNGQWVWELA